MRTLQNHREGVGVVPGAVTAGTVTLVLGTLFALVVVWG